MSFSHDAELDAMIACWRSATDVAADPMWLVSEDLRVLALNQAAQSEFGRIVGAPCRQWFQLENPDGPCPLEQTLKLRRPVVERVLVTRRDDQQCDALCFASASPARQNGLGHITLRFTWEGSWDQLTGEERSTMARDLRDRVRELSALHRFAALFQAADDSIEATLARVADLMPNAFQSPRIRGARIRYDGCTAHSDEGRDLHHYTSVEFVTRFGKPGVFEILHDPPSEGEPSPIRKADRLLIATVRDMLVGWLERNDAENALKMIRSAVEQSGDLVLLLDSEGRPIYANHVVQRALGFTGEELAGLRFAEFAVIPGFDSWVVLTRRLDHQPRLTIDVRCRRSDGSSVPVEFRASRLHECGRTFVCLFGVDVEERRSSEDRFLKVFNQSPVAISITSLGEGRLVDANDLFFSLLRMSPTEAMGKTGVELGIWPNSAAHSALIAQLVENGSVHNREHTLRMGPHEVVQLLGSAELIQIGGEMCVLETDVDITSRIRAESAARHLAAIVENTDDAIFGQSLDGVVTSWNAAAARIFGYSAQERIGDSDSALIPTALLDEKRRIVEQLKSGSRVKQLETLRLHKTGREIHVSLTISPTLDDHGGLVGFSTIARDITEHRALEQQLRQSQKMEAVGHLAGGVAHDFNNLLTVINGYVNMMLSSRTADDDDFEPLREVSKAGERASNLTRQLLAFSRKQVMQPVALNLNSVVLDMEKMLRRLIAEDMELEVKLEPGLDWTKADRGQLEQVLMNLVVNARDAMPVGGRITIETRNVEVDDLKLTPHSELSPGRYASFTVSDTGVGMPDDVKQRIFEPFFSTKDSGRGTGLGLSVVYGIVKQSLGHIEVDSSPGVGSSFHVLLPRTDSPAHSVEDPHRRAPSPRGFETVLVAEDEDSVRTLTCRILEMNGYRVLAAATGKRALELAEQHEGEIDILVTDVVMPGMSGQQLADSLTALRPKLHVLYLSGYTEEAVSRRGQAAVKTHFLPKPFSPSALASKVRQILDA